MKKLRFVQNIALALTLIFIGSCGGGGGSSSSNSTNPETPIDTNLTSINISGNVIDNDTQLPLINAKITVEGLAEEGNTDEEGNFSLDIETDKNTLLVNSSAQGFSTSQKIIEVDHSNSEQIPFTSIALKSSAVFDSTILSSIASSGKKFSEAVEVPVAKVSVNVNTENLLIPGNSSTDESETNIDFLAALEITLINPETNENIATVPSDFSYDISFTFKIDESNIDLAGLPLWTYEKTLGKWVLPKKAELISSSEEAGIATLVYRIYKIGWFAIGKRIIGLACLKGQVVDQIGNPVSGAKVIVDGVSFNGQNYGATNKKGIFEIKTKPGATIKVTATYSNVNTETETVFLQNYTHNQDSAADNTYCQPAGPIDKADPFYTNFPEFVNLVPPSEFEATIDSDGTPLTLTLPFHKIKGTITYITAEGSKPLPKQPTDSIITNVIVNSYGAFPLTADGVIEFSLPIKENTTLSASVIFKEKGLVYVGNTEIPVDITQDSTSFTMILETSTVTTISGNVKINGFPAPNATVSLSTGVATSANGSGEYKLEIPSSQTPNGTTISATFKQLNTGEIYFSNIAEVTTETNQIIDLEIQARSSKITGLVFDQLNNPIENAKIFLLIDEKPFGINTLTNASGEYAIVVPSNGNESSNIKIQAKAEQSNGTLIASGFTNLQIGNVGSDSTETPNYTADKIILDLSSKDTKVKGKIQINGVFQPGVLVIFDSFKTETGANGEFTASVNPGKNILSVFVGNEPALLAEGVDNKYEFSAVQGTELDLGTLSARTKNPFVYFTTIQFQNSSSADALPIKSAVAGPKSVVYFQLVAKGNNESPKITLINSVATLFSESSDSTTLTTTNIFEVSTINVGLLTLNFEASETNSTTTKGSKSLLIVSENQAPVITGIKLENTEIESTNSTGIALAVSANDPEGSSLSYQWKIESPVDSTATITGSETNSIVLTTSNTTASEIILTITVSDGEKSSAKKVLLKVISAGPKLLSFDLSPLGILGVGKELTANLITDDSIPISSTEIFWGDGSSTANLKKSKSITTSHAYEKEGTYSIEAILIGKNNVRSSFRKTIIVSETYRAPVLIQGTLSTLEDTATKLDLGTLIENFDKTKVYTFSIVKSPALGKATIETNNLIYNPNLNQNGFDLLVIKAFDGLSFSNDIDIKISIKPANDAPVVKDGTADGTPGVTIQIDLKKLTADPDSGDLHTFKITQDPTLGSATLEGSILSYLPNKAGLDSLTFIASDGNSTSNTARISIKINEVSVDISLTGGAFQTTQNKEASFDLTPFLVNPKGVKPIIFVISQKGTLGDSFISGNNLVYVPTKDITGDDKITIIAKTDSGQSSEPALFTMKILPAAQSPVLKNGNFSVKEGDTISIELTKLVSNFDLTKTYVFEILSSGNPIKGTGSITGTVLSYSPFKGSSGIDNISITATSEKLISNTALLTFTIETLIQLPVITSTPIITINEGSAYLYRIEAFHPGNLPLTYLLKTGPAWLRLELNSLSGLPGQSDVGIHQVTIAVQDGTNSVEQSFALEVININFSPSFTSTPPTTATSTFPYVYLMSATDPDGDELSFALLEGPAGMNIDSKAKTLSWTPLPTDPTSNFIIIEVSDGKLTQTQKFNIDLTISSPSIKSFIAKDPDNGDTVFSKQDTITITFDQATNTPEVTKVADITALLKFNESIGDDYTGEWVTKSQLVITIIDAGNANPGIGSLRVLVNKSGNLLNEARTSNPSSSASDILKGNWGKN